MGVKNILWNVRSDYIHNLARENKREDNRKLDEYRKIEVLKDYVPNALGSCLVKIGSTQVLAGVSLAIGTPYPDSPESGAMMTGCELLPMAFEEFESGPPRPPSVELARVVDRGIRESEALDFGKLCITPGEEVWMVMIDMHVLDYQGNLFDAAELAATTALHNTYFPKVEDGKIIRGERTKNKLPMTKKPIETTFVKIGDMIAVDPSLDEDMSLDARLTIATVEDGFCAAQKGGTGSFTRKELDELINLSIKKGKELRKKV